MVNSIITISIISILIFIGLALYFAFRASEIKSSVSKKTPLETPQELGEIISERWQAVLGHLNTSSESDWKLAVIEADKLIDDLLKARGLKGESMAERLTAIEKDQLAALDLLWEAHKVRNRIVHQSGYKITQPEVRRIISFYEEALKELLAAEI